MEISAKTIRIWGILQIVLGVVLLALTIAFLPVAGAMRTMDEELHRCVEEYSHTVKRSADAFATAFQNILPLTNDVVKSAAQIRKVSDSLQTARDKVARQREKFGKWAKRSSISIPNIHWHGLDTKITMEDKEIGPLKEFFDDRAANCADWVQQLTDLTSTLDGVSTTMLKESSVLSDYAGEGFPSAMESLRKTSECLDGIAKILSTKPMALGSLFVATLGFVLSFMAFFNGVILFSAGRNHSSPLNEQKV